MENQSALANVSARYKSLSLVAKTSVQNGETGADGAVALLAVGRVSKQGTDPALVLESVQERTEKKESVKRDHVLNGVHGETGQAALHHAGRVSGIESGSVDLLQGT